MPDAGQHTPEPRPHRPPHHGADRPPAAVTSLDPAIEKLLADLVEHVLIIAKEYRTRDLTDDDAEVRIDGAEAMVMYYIHHHPGGSPSEVARASRLQRSNLSATLRSLEARGMVERRPHPVDARQVRLFPTPVATRAFRKGRAEWALLAASDLPPPYEGLVETVGTLTRITQSIKDRRW